MDTKDQTIKNQENREKTEQEVSKNEKPTEKKDPFQRILQKYLKLNHPTLEFKQPKCKHANGCLTQIIDITLKGGLSGYAVKVALNIIGLLLRQPQKLLKKPHLFIMAFFKKECINHALFPGIYNFVLQSMMCILKNSKIECKDKKLQQKIENSREIIDPFLSGFLAGFFSLLVKPQKNRAIWGLFLITRALECLYNQAIKKGYLPDTKYNWVLIFSLMWINQGYNIAMEPGNCPPSFIKFIGTQMNQDVGDYTFNLAWIKKKNFELKQHYGSAVKTMNPYNASLVKKPTKNVNLFGHKQHTL